MSESFALSFFGIAVVAVAVLAAFAVRPRWRLGGLLLAAAVWTIGMGLRGENPWPASFEMQSLCLVTAGVLAVVSKRFAPMLPAVLLLWFLGAGTNSTLLSIDDAVRDFHRLNVVAFAGVGLAAFSRLVALAWNSESIGPQATEGGGGGWKAVSNATGLLLFALILTLVFELIYRAEPLGLQSPLGLLTVLAESVAGICLWRATVQTSKLEEHPPLLGHGAKPVGWITLVGLMVVFILTGLAFTMIPILVTTD